MGFSLTASRVPDGAPEILSNVLMAVQLVPAGRAGGAFSISFPLAAAAAGAQQPGSFGLGPQSASQNLPPLLTQLQTRACQRSDGSGSPP